MYKICRIALGRIPFKEKLPNDWIVLLLLTVLYLIFIVSTGRFLFLSRWMEFLFCFLYLVDKIVILTRAIIFALFDKCQFLMEVLLSCRGNVPLYGCQMMTTDECRKLWNTLHEWVSLNRRQSILNDFNYRCWSVFLETASLPLRACVRRSFLNNHGSVVEWSRNFSYFSEALETFSIYLYCSTKYEMVPRECMHILL